MAYNTEKQRRYNLHESGLNAVSGTLSTSRVYIKEIKASNMSGAALYFQVFDTGSLPVNGNIPRRSYQVAANSVLSLLYEEEREYHTGAVYAWSGAYSTLATGSFTQISVDIDYQ